MKKLLLATAMLAAITSISAMGETNPYAQCYDGRSESAKCVMKVMAALNHKPGDAEEFVLGDTVVFNEPTMSCPNVDDAITADRQTPDWLAAHDCQNLNPRVKEWIVVSGGKEWLKRNGQIIRTDGCVVNKQRYDQLNNWAEGQRGSWGAKFEIGQTLQKECRNVVRKVAPLP